MSEKDKTIIIVILAFVIMSGCLIASCCAGSLLILSRTDKNTIIEFLNDSGSDIDNKQDGQAVVVNNDELFQKHENETGLSQAEKKIIEATEKTRGLSAEANFVPVYQTEDELRDYMIKQLEDISDEDLQNELGLYNVLGFAPKDFDLYQFYVDMYTEQIAGFYDPKENQIYLIENDSPYNKAVTLAHEYTHYLQYNNPDFQQNLIHDDDFCEENGEECIIIDALIEGDASVTEGLVDINAIIGSYKDNTGNSSANENSVFYNAPKYFQDSLLFPYQYGYDFVAYYYLKGGYDEVNQLFINLPKSVEQIIHPEKYLKDDPINIEMEPFRTHIANKFDIVKDDVLNESDIMMILNSGYNTEWQLGDRQAAAGADGWGGGGYIFARNDSEPLFFSKTVWDSEKEAKEAEIAFSNYCDKRFGAQNGKQTWVGEDGASVYLIRQNDILYWMILPPGFVPGDFVDLIQNGSSL